MSNGMDIRSILAECQAEHRAAKQGGQGVDPLLLEQGMVRESAASIVRYREQGMDVVKATRDYRGEESTYFMARAVLANNIGEAFGVRLTVNKHDREFHWYGFDADIDMVEDLFDLLEPQMIAEVLDYDGFGSASLRAQREDFAVAYGHRVGERLMEFYRTSGAAKADMDWRDREVAAALPRGTGVTRVAAGVSAAGRAAGGRANIAVGGRQVAA